MHVYDLPKHDDISSQLMIALHEEAGIVLQNAPKIDRNPSKDLYSGILQMSASSQEEIDQICERIRYFQIEGKDCRALIDDASFKKDLSISNKDKNKCKVCVQKVPKDLKQRDLHKIFEKYGKIESL